MPVDHQLIVRTLLQHRARLLGHLMGIVRDYHAAEDILQEVSAEAIGASGEIKDAEHLLRWLRQVARFRAIDHLRRRGRQPLVLDAAVLDALEARWQETDNGDDSERAAALRRCMRQLSPYGRQLVALRYGEGRTGEDLAARLGRKVNAIYVALRRVHRTLASCVAREAPRA